MNKKAKFIIDESVDFPAVSYLRNQGYDVTSIVEEHPSLEDMKILRMAYEQNRILVANDKDFGYLVFKLKLKSKGVILFRLANQSSKAKIRALEILIKRYLNKLAGNFVVISESKVRIKKLP